MRSVQRISAGHGLQPHRLRTFKRSSDPLFAAKLDAIVGLYLEPPAHSLVLSLDEKAISRRSTAPSRASRSSRNAGTMTHYYMRHGTTTLFAAVNSRRTVVGRFLRGIATRSSGVPNRSNGRVPAGKVIHVILDNYAAHKHPKSWPLVAHPRLTFHFTPSSDSSL